MKIDLHTHTYFSDGSWSPMKVVALAQKRGVKILAITDHDVITGVKEAIKAAKDKNIKVIPGIEITSRVDCSKDSIHIVGLYIDINSLQLKKMSDEMIEFKKYKVKKRLKIVNKYFGSSVTAKDLKKKTKGEPGLPHIAMVLLDKNYVKNIKEGIRSMTKGGPCYISFKSKNIHARKAIRIIHESGGLAILAHLASYKNENKFKTFNEQEDLIKELVKYGLDGLEIYIPNTSKKEIKFGEKLVRKYNLKISCGSDFHDEKFIPKNKLGFLDIAKEKITVLKN